MTLDFGVNAGLVDELRERFRADPAALDAKWRAHFDSEGGLGLPSPASPLAPDTAQPAPTPAATRVLTRERVVRLVEAYRARGHLLARTDPLGIAPRAATELDLARFDLTERDLDAVFPELGVEGVGAAPTLRQVLQHLSQTYCHHLGVEFAQVEDPRVRSWLQSEMESSGNRPGLGRDDALRVLGELTDTEVLEQFIHKSYIGAKRFSIEGSESLVPMLDLFVEEAGARGVTDVVLAMAHRGRLSVMVNVVGKDPRELFAQFDDRDAGRFLGAGDVKYHLGYSNDRVTRSGAKVHVSLAYNPSHLEFVGPVALGRTRAKQDRLGQGRVMPILVHGDAAFMGQGVVAETLNLTGLPGYATGGTLHVVVNNQVGFTTAPSDSRSTRYATDIAGMLKTPTFHVNGDDPEAVIQAARLAVELRQRFGRDVVIDLCCYRRYGHNEGDEPRFTQPLMYARIDALPTVRALYARQLVEKRVAEQAEVDALTRATKTRLEAALREERTGDFLRSPDTLRGVWRGYVGGQEAAVPDVPTGVPCEQLLTTLQRLTTLPVDFQAHPKARKILEARLDRAEKQGTLFWETGEALAFATLVSEGTRVRLSGQDSRRGTFSHRHAVLYDTHTGAPYTPIEQAAGEAGRGLFQVWDSPLSEAGVLGFDYGYSLDSPSALVVWEAQFGDFANGGQVIIDQFLASAERKWQRLSGLVLMLPHGYEGQGPEHSSARIERWLQLFADDNVQVCNPTTPAQLFHLLRRQVRRPWRKPLVILTPKSLLRHPLATSRVGDLATGAFRRVIPDEPPAGLGARPHVRRVLLTSGKVYYDLVKARDEGGHHDVAIVRLEQYCPLGPELRETLRAYAPGTDLVWVQEEPRNMGAWAFVREHVPGAVGADLALRAVAREPSASPATGSKASHDLEQRTLLREAFRP